MRQHGFAVLNYRDTRIAYLRHIAGGHFELYEPWNAAAWTEMLGEQMSMMVALQQALDDGRLTMVRIQRTPTQSLYRADYDLTGCRLSCAGECWMPAGQPLFKQLFFDPAPVLGALQPDHTRPALTADRTE